MQFVFDYEETLSRRVSIEADTLSDALVMMHDMLDSERLVLNGEDFCTGKISLPLERNSPYFVRLERCGETVTDVTDLDIVLEEW